MTIYWLAHLSKKTRSYIIEIVFLYQLLQLLSTRLPQNGRDEAGILGFLDADIKKWVKSCRYTKCCYCKKNGASIECSRISCKKNFHLICGKENDCLFEFVDAFKSYCHEHHGLNKHNPHPILPRSCFICHGSMGHYNPVKWIPSCCNRGWFHGDCMRENAISAGYLFKCPLCGCSKDEYIQLIRERGIFLPDRDASWELEPNAYDSFQLTLSCNAKPCLCPYGPIHAVKQSKSKWFLLKCIFCGSNAMHKLCSNNNSNQYKCADCTIDVNSDTQQLTQDALVSVIQFGARYHRKRTIILVEDMPSPGTNYIEDEEKLRQIRLNLLFDRS